MDITDYKAGLAAILSLSYNDADGRHTKTIFQVDKEDLKVLNVFIELKEELDFYSDFYSDKNIKLLCNNLSCSKRIAYAYIDQYIDLTGTAEDTMYYVDKLTLVRLSGEINIEKI
jgi:hypothetical protein